MEHFIKNVMDEFTNYVHLKESDDLTTLKIRTGFYLPDDIGKQVFPDLRTECVLSKKQLHNFIGTLLHIQSKMK